MVTAPQGTLDGLKGLGPARRKALEQIGVTTPLELLFVLPTAFRDRSRVGAGAELLGFAASQQESWLRGEVLAHRWGRPRGSRTHMSMRVDCAGQELLVHWFRGARAASARAPKGEIRWFQGPLRMGKNDLPALVHPEIQPDGPCPARGVEPVYDLPKGLGPKTFSAWLAQLLEAPVPELSRGTGQPEGLDLRSALRILHGLDPLVASEERRSKAWARVALEALSAHQGSLVHRREEARHGDGLVCQERGLEEGLLDELGFPLSEGQEEAWALLSADLESGVPMRRLLQGDVGAGKTVLALLCASRVVAAGGQVALLSPTALVARQQAQLLQQWMAPLGVRVAGLWQGRRDARRVRDGLAVGAIDVVAGTHALMSAETQFRHLSLVVVDEQHRFGVAQRMRLIAKGTVPHLLAMSATPIPRSLALAIHGDLDLTLLAGGAYQRRVHTRVRSLQEEHSLALELATQGRRTFVVCPRRVSDGVLPGVEETAARWSQWLGAKVDWVHGAMDAEATQNAVHRFASGQNSVLVATTVVEVGLDVASADALVVLSAEMHGLSTLHQLRGRVGRKGQESVCYLLAKTEALERIAAMESIADGMELARLDLEQRGPGQIFGARQSGVPHGLLALGLRHPEILAQARDWALGALPKGGGAVLAQCEAILRGVRAGRLSKRER